MKKKLTILVIVLPLICYMVYFFPVQRHLAEKAFNDYILLQGVSEENIQSKMIYKDYKQDGYSIDVVYKDDPEYRYAYKYYVGKSSHKYNMMCVVYNKRNISVNVTGEKVKYPSID